MGALVAALGVSPPLAAQVGFGDAPAGTPPPSQPAAPSQPKADPNQPDVHPATGGDTTLPEGSEPTLPADPLALRHRVRTKIGTDLLPEDQERGRGTEAETERQFYGLWYSETSQDYSLKLAFPVWAERRMPSLTEPRRPDRASLYGGLYYQRRSAERADDVLFPLAWNLRDLTAKSRTTVVGPFVNRRAPQESDDWLAPLYFTGSREVGGYTVIPPLLTVLTSGRSGGFNLVGPAYCSWKGGQQCDTRTAQSIDFGVAPLYFYGQDARKKYELIPPLLHYYGYDDTDRSYVNVWGPYYRERTKSRELLHVLPFYWSIWGEQERHTTLFPFFHYGHRGARESLLVTPLFLNHTNEAGEQTLVTWGYARHRGRTQLDMITPLFWHYQDPTIGEDMKLLFPFYYSKTSPREDNLALFPFWGNFERFGIRETTFITPLFQHTTHLRGWSTNLHPILYLGRNASQSHTVVAPFFWDFVGRESRATVGFPIFWRFSDATEVTQLVGNVFYHEKKRKNGLDWQIHVFPVFSYGETPDGHWWNVLYGLAGYTRQGELTRLRTLWIPITLSEPARAVP